MVRAARETVRARFMLLPSSSAAGNYLIARRDRSARVYRRRATVSLLVITNVHVNNPRTIPRGRGRALNRRAGTDDRSFPRIPREPDEPPARSSRPGRSVISRARCRSCRVKRDRRDASVPRLALYPVLYIYYTHIRAHVRTHGRRIIGRVQESLPRERRESSARSRCSRANGSRS